MASKGRALAQTEETNAHFRALHCYYRCLAHNCWRGPLGFKVSPITEQDFLD
jgi:hypothetical protein